MIKIKINNIEYKNIASAKPKIEYDYNYDVKTIDGIRHREIRGKRTNYTIVFYNDLKNYDFIKSLLKSSNSVSLEIDSVKADYFVTINGDEIKGYLYNGILYKTALEVNFEAVKYE